MVIISEFDFGQAVKDIITDYEGIITSVRQDYGGQPLYLIVPKALDQYGEPNNGVWFPKERLELIEGSLELSPEILIQKTEVPNEKNNTPNKEGKSPS